LTFFERGIFFWRHFFQGVLTEDIIPGVSYYVVHNKNQLTGYGALEFPKICFTFFHHWTYEKNAVWKKKNAFVGEFEY